MIRTSLYVPPFVVLADVGEQLRVYCEAVGYDIVSIDTDGKPWWESLEAAHETGIEVILAADRGHLPPGYAPRLEIADLALLRPDLPDLGRDPSTRTRHRRPRPV